MPFEIEVELQDSLVELTLESMSFLYLPFSVHDRESYILIRSPSMESDSVRVLCSIGLDEELRCDRLVKQVWVEDVELVALDNFRRGILTIVVGLIVLVPFIALLD